MKGNSSSFNNAGSSSVQQVDVKISVGESHKLSMNGTPNSVTQKQKNGKVTSERYYDSQGKAYLDIDYTNHGNAKTHPVVPHEHHISYINGQPRRGKGKKVE